MLLSEEQANKKHIPYDTRCTTCLNFRKGCTKWHKKGYGNMSYCEAHTKYDRVKYEQERRKQAFYDGTFDIGRRSNDDIISCKK